jgi:hypothetical protein
MVLVTVALAHAITDGSRREKSLGKLYAGFDVSHVDGLDRTTSNRKAGSFADGCLFVAVRRGHSRTGRRIAFEVFAYACTTAVNAEGETSGARLKVMFIVFLRPDGSA